MKCVRRTAYAYVSRLTFWNVCTIKYSIRVLGLCIDVNVNVSIWYSIFLLLFFIFFFFFVLKLLQLVVGCYCCCYLIRVNWIDTRCVYDMGWDRMECGGIYIYIHTTCSKNTSHHRQANMSTAYLPMTNKLITTKVFSKIQSTT